MKITSSKRSLYISKALIFVLYFSLIDLYAASEDIVETIRRQSQLLELQPNNKTISNITIFLPGRNLNDYDYKSTIDVLHEQGQNVLFIDSIRDQIDYARKVPIAFDYYVLQTKSSATSYNIIGHSFGAKIALMVAAKYDPKRVGIVISLDPNDDDPPMFTDSTTPSKSLSLLNIPATIFLTVTDGGPTISSDHQASAIEKFNPGIPVHKDEDASHVCYCDPDPGRQGSLSLKIFRATLFRPKSGDAAALQHAQEMIVEHLSV